MLAILAFSKLRKLLDSLPSQDEEEVSKLGHKLIFSGKCLTSEINQVTFGNFMFVLQLFPPPSPSLLLPLSPKLKK